ncbi:biliverdin-producing heme oxygenase [Actinomadura rupiterrae]|uniref:biliverdin-producing heme oxygenase n=1 Tax=Actinomadura rupiterrae TaxID=559627 RepID=UPI0020A45414|nr:biliverdin-producing heme oxygenase [Actinomadura rupiterrae]MCP2342601.1 heme oxygenase [Actinomadura rupiterrae]
MGTDRATARRAGPEGFAAELRAATRRDHDEIQGSAFLTDLVEGRLDRAAYARYLGQLCHIYDALEDLTDRWAADPVTAAFDLPGLRRRDALHADLAHFQGRPGAPVPTAATRRYVAAIRAAGKRRGGFVAHHYIRYMGDLSGGQYMGQQIRKVFGLQDGADGARFYAFPGKPKSYKDRYRAQLDRAPWDAAERAHLIAEVRRAYRLNADLTAAL